MQVANYLTDSTFPYIYRCLVSHNARRDSFLSLPPEFCFQVYGHVCDDILEKTAKELTPKSWNRLRISCRTINFESQAREGRAIQQVTCEKCSQL
jgi:hypothetical protein